MTIAEHDTQAAQVEVSPGRRQLILTVMCMALGAVVGMLVSLVIALPGIAQDLRASEAELQWVMNAYGIVFAGLLLPGGALGDRYGRKGVLLAGLVIFIGASGAVLWADDVGTVIALRAVAGAGAALVMPMTLSVITSVFPPEERGRAVGIWSGVFAGGGLLGVMVAGALLEGFSWRSVFVFNAILGLVALLAAAAVTPKSRDPYATPLDIPGTVFSVVGIASLVFSIVEGPERGWSDGLIVGGFAVAVVTLTAFAYWELRSQKPMLDLRVFRIRGVSGGSLAIMTESLGAFGVLFLLLQFLQEIKGYSPFEAGLALLPLAIGAIVFSPTAPMLAQRFGFRIVIGLGMAAMAGGLALLSLLDQGSASWPVLAGGLLIGAGVAYAATPATDAIVAALPAAKQGVASALNDITRELGAVLGIAILGSVFNATYRGDVGDATEKLPPDIGEAARDSLTAALQIAQRLGGGEGTALADVAKAAFSTGMNNAMLVGVAVVIVGGVIAVVALPSQASPETRQPQKTDTRT
ncbi:MFS transporter [Actinomadura rudentiformis]|uniref:MFS transporter n=1 Tax=Actinomadura rudentiformis TaxID=359158 RepID=A0A6H9Z1D5_9ACTN|nr:MFS transporter [Actinomadura rudentiformis]KAB2346945.1 MFS transporter [Actinomadura rudentiformis]